MKTLLPIILDTVSQSLNDKGLKVTKIVLPAGEDNKNFSTVETLVNAVLDGRA